MDASLEVFDALSDVAGLPPISWPNVTEIRAIPRLVVQRGATRKQRLGVTASFQEVVSFVVTVVSDTNESDTVPLSVYNSLVSALAADRRLGDYVVEAPPTMGAPFPTDGEYNTPIRFTVRGYSAS